MRPIATRTASIVTTFTAAAIASLLAAQPAPAAASWTWPVAGDVITPYRNGDDPYAAGQHRGIDIAAGVGTPVVAAAGGEVRYAGTAGSSGLTVSVRTTDGLDTSYLHLSSLTVRAGSHVSTGDRLGAVGTTGTRSATQPHLHFGVREAGSRHAYRDPLAFLPPPASAPPAEPRPAPAPLPTPAPTTPHPAPAPTPRTAPHRVPVRAPRRMPAGAPRRMPAGAPRRMPAGAPRRAPTGDRLRVPAAGPHRIPEETPRRSPSDARRKFPARPPSEITVHAPGRPPAASPHHMPTGSSAGTAAAHRPATGPTAQASTARAARAAPGRGPDLGFALACAGILLAAAILGLTEGGRRTSARGRARLAGALRPLARR